MFRNRIMIQKNNVSKEEFNDVDDWQNFYSARCDIVTNMGTSMFEAQAAGYERTVTVYLRKCKKALEITPVAYRFLYKDQIYDIISIDNVNEQNKQIRLKGGLKL